MSYSAKLRDEREIYIPDWPVNVALKNLTEAGKLFGIDALVSMSEINVPAAMMAITEAENPSDVMDLVSYFVCQARIAEQKIEIGTLDDIFAGHLFPMVELFCHVLHAQYHEFFSLGLAKVPSPSK